MAWASAVKTPNDLTFSIGIGSEARAGHRIANIRRRVGRGWRCGGCGVRDARQSVLQYASTHVGNDDTPQPLV